MTTPNGSPELSSGQAVPETTVNEQIRRTERGASWYPVVDKDLTAPPGSCADGAAYIVAASPTGAWSGKAKYIAIAVGTNAASGWYFRAPEEGMFAWVQDEDLVYRYTGSAWVAYTPSGTIGGALGANDNALLRADGTGGATAQGSAIIVSDAGAFTFPDDVRQVFNPGASNAGLNVGALSGDPSSPTDGDLWYDSAANELTARINGANVALGVPTAWAVTTQSGTSYTAVLGDGNSTIEFSNAGAITFTIPPNASVAFQVGAVIEIIQAGGGAVTPAAGAGVTLNVRTGFSATAGQWAVAAVRKVATNTWVLTGDLT